MSSITGLCPDGKPVRTITLAANGVQLTLMDWGATWLSCQVMLEQKPREILLGCAQLEDYLTQTAFLGATVGRYANRIGQARFKRGEREYHLLPTGNTPHQLHGGPNAFHARRWQIIEQSSAHVVLAIESADGDQGFPGHLVASVCYRVLENGQIHMEYTAKVDAACPINFTNHAYFNLDGAPSDVRRHTLRINAQQYLPTDAELIPLGPLAPVAGSSFDFTHAKRIERDFLADAQQQQTQGYDHAFLLDESCRGLKNAAATLVSGDKRLTMMLYTSKPALQFYSGNYLAGIPARHGVYSAYQGLALETQFLPDSPNHPEWPQPSCWLEPGETYQHTTILAFQGQD